MRRSLQREFRDRPCPQRHRLEQALLTTGKFPRWRCNPGMGVPRGEGPLDLPTLLVALPSVATLLVVLRGNELPAMNVGVA